LHLQVLEVVLEHLKSAENRAKAVVALDAACELGTPLFRCAAEPHSLT